MAQYQYHFAKAPYGKDMLQKLSVVDGDCFLAGGACRDYLEGRTPNDYDYYFYVRGMRTIQQGVDALELATGLTIYHKQKTEFGGAYAEHNPYLHRVYEGMDKFNNKFQFMLLTEPVSADVVVENFPLSNCKLYCEWDFIHTTTDYEIGSKHKVIFKTSNLYSEENPYIKKIKARYPDIPYFETKEDAVQYILGVN